MRLHMTEAPVIGSGDNRCYSRCLPCWLWVVCPVLTLVITLFLSEEGFRLKKINTDPIQGNMLQYIPYIKSYLAF